MNLQCLRLQTQRFTAI